MQHNEIHHDTNNPEHDHAKEDEHQPDEEMILSERDQRMLGAESTDSTPAEEEQTEEETSSDSTEKEIEETEEIAKLREKLQDIRGPYLKLKWDAEHDQINPGQRTRYDKLKKEYEELESALKRELEKQK